MRKTYKIIFLLFFILLINHRYSFSQDSSRLRISLLTCTPGEELYSIFGHSAIRIIDSNSVTDYIYNYGTFDFEEKDFYLKFMRGKLLYFVSAERTDDFINIYAYEKRGITEQVLNLSDGEKRKLQHALNENLKEENRFYKYDFFLDNCTTRLRDLIAKNQSISPVLPAVMSTQTTYRQAIHQYLEKGGQYWSELGIDLLLGARTDKIMTASEQQFLPDNLMNSIDSCKNVKMVKEKSILYAPTDALKTTSLFTPMNCFAFILILVLGLGFINNPIIQKSIAGFDFVLFICTGLLGIILILMWFATDHSMTKSNFNLLWALPTNIIAAFYLNKKSKNINNYLKTNSILCLLLLLCWFILPQQLNVSLIPVILLIGVRSFKNINRSKSS